MKQDHLGLTMICATLAAIALIVAALVFRQTTEHEKRVHAQGVGLTQSLASLPFDQLANGPEQAGILQTMVRVQRSPAFAYGLLVSPTGAKLVEVAVASLPPDAPLPHRPPCLTDNECAEAGALLDAVLAHWQALRGTRVDGLRSSFLQRRGWIEPRDGAWLLRVEPESFDLLLGRLPWSLGLVRLPWMRQPLFTEWNTP